MTAGSREKIEVLPAGSVAVAVTSDWPAGGAATAAEKAALPAASVVTVVAPRNV